jgi:hypothetical protein
LAKLVVSSSAQPYAVAEYGRTATTWSTPSASASACVTPHAGDLRLAEHRVRRELRGQVLRVAGVQQVVRDDP